MKHFLNFAPALLLTLSLSFLSGFENDCVAKKVKYNLKTPKQTQKTTAPAQRTAPLDSITTIEVAPLLKFSGYDKAASSNKESFFITNNSQYPIHALEIELVYTNLEGRMIHKRSELINADIPQGETRACSIKTFDFQKSLYYKKSTPPRYGGMPFDVSIKIISISTPL